MAFFNFGFNRAIMSSEQKIKKSKNQKTKVGTGNSFIMVSTIDIGGKERARSKTFGFAVSKI